MVMPLVRVPVPVPLLKPGYADLMALGFVALLAEIGRTRLQQVID